MAISQSLRPSDPRRQYGEPDSRDRQFQGTTSTWPIRIVRKLLEQYPGYQRNSHGCGSFTGPHLRQ